MSISPVDGRYAEQTKELQLLFSEYAFTKYRIIVELSWLKHLSQHNIAPPLTKIQKKCLEQITNHFTIAEFDQFKKIENITKHDVKAIEYYLHDVLNKLGLKKHIPFIHFGLTSDDINNVAYALMLKNCNDNILTPLLFNVRQIIKRIARKTKNIPILARTHGQPAIPTTFGKEMANYLLRIQKQYSKMVNYAFEGKCNGAVGNYSSLNLTFPQKDWLHISTSFLKKFRLHPNLLTTQILPYDNWIEFFQIISLINMICIDISTNIWNYIMLEVLAQTHEKGQVGSSTMPQKINPIDFENTEGNLQVANVHFELYLRKLSLSRLQRDLSDSTVRRTFGEAFAYVLLGWKSLIAGLGKISINEKQTKKELDSHWEILSEAVQTFLRTKNDASAYEKLKLLTQGRILTKKTYREMLKKLELDEEKDLINLSPDTYIGLASKLTDLVLE